MRRKNHFFYAFLKKLENDDHVRKTRFISGIAFAVCLIVLIMERTSVLVSANFKIASDYIFLALLLVQFLFPASSILLGFIALSEGLMDIYFGGNILGFLFYGFGLALLLKEGFFRTDKRFKIPLAIIIFSIALASQYRLGFNKLIISLINIILAMAIILGFLVTLHGNLKSFYSIRPPLDLSSFKLTQRQIACIRGCSERKRITDIAKQANEPESAIRDALVELYDILDVYDRHDLYRMLEGRTIIFEPPKKKAGQ